MAILLIAVGLLFTGIDIHGLFGIYYPDINVVGVVGKFQLS